MSGAGMMARVLVTASVASAWAVPASALPTMVRIGYTGCAACHFSPQGAGPLTDYGRGIDQAQSLRGGEYHPPDRPRRLTHDLRFLIQEQGTWINGSRENTFRPRLMYRNVTDVSKVFRLSGIVTVEGASAPRPTRAYDPATKPSTVFVNTALVHYRPAETLEIAAGRDQLPSGVNVPDLSAFIKSRNRLGYYDSPTQLKAFWWGKRHQVTPFVYGPGGNEATGDREFGGGTLAEFEVLGNQRMVIGTTLLRGSARNGDRRLLGGYARLGFGSWGVLAEHDSTDRTRPALATGRFRQQATYAQIFWAAREWLVLSAFGERLRVAPPFEQRLNAGRFEVAARLAPQATIVLSSRVERDMRTGRVSRSLILQTAVKTVR